MRQTLSNPGTRRAFLRANGLWVGVLVSFTLVCLVGPLLAPYSPTAVDIGSGLRPPSGEHWFGTDELGRDVLSRLLHGALPTMGLAFASTFLGVFLGTVTGLVAGYYRGRLDDALMRLMDALISFPALVLAMLIVVMLGPSALNVLLAIGVVFWPRTARIVRSVVMQIGGQDYVLAARARGESTPYILIREILPNVWWVILVDLSLRMTVGVLMSTSLAYLGVGVRPPSPAWGLIINDGQHYLQLAPWLVIFPCLTVSIAAVLLVLVGESIRRRLGTPKGGLLQ